MRSSVIAFSLVVLSGCGSCVEEKRAPEVEQARPTIQTITQMTEAGPRPVVVRDDSKLSDFVKRDGGS